MKYIVACMFAFAVGATAFAQDYNNSLNGTSNGDQNSQNMPATSPDDDAGDNYVREHPGSLGDTSAQYNDRDRNQYNDYNTAGSASSTQQSVDRNANNSPVNADTSSASKNAGMSGASVKNNNTNEDKKSTTTTTKVRVGKDGQKTTTTKTVTKTLYDKNSSQSSGDKKKTFSF